jgi:hypothetical protein
MADGWDAHTVMGAAYGEIEHVEDLRPKATNERMWSEIFHMVRISQGSAIGPDLWNRILASSGLPGFHTRDVVDAHSLSSYAGLHVVEIARLAQSVARRVAGRTPADYEAYPSHLVLTTHAESYNKVARRKHMQAIADGQREALRDRIIALQEHRATHRGDQRWERPGMINGEPRSAADMWATRLVYLRMRKSVFDSIQYTDDLAYNINDLLTRIAKNMKAAFRSAAQRGRIKNPALPDHSTISNMEHLGVFAATLDVIAAQHADKMFWDADAAIDAITEALKWIDQDISRQLATVYAVHPTEARRRAARTTIVGPPAPEAVVPPSSGNELILADDEFLIGDDDDPDVFFAPAAASEPAWQQALVAAHAGLLHNTAFAPTIPIFEDAHDLLAQGIHFIPAAEIRAAVPTLEALYREAGFNYAGTLSEILSNEALTVEEMR